MKKKGFDCLYSNECQIVITQLFCNNTIFLDDTDSDQELKVLPPSARQKPKYSNGKSSKFKVQFNLPKDAAGKRRGPIDRYIYR